MKSIVRGNYVEWVAEYRWRLIGVLTVRPGLHMKKSRNLLHQWFGEIEVAERRELSWLAFPERGSSENLHFHVLISGIASRVYRHVRRWEQLAGHAHFLRFDSHHPGKNGSGRTNARAGIDYTIKGLRSDDYDFEGHLHDRHLLPRFQKLAKESK